MAMNPLIYVLYFAWNVEAGRLGGQEIVNRRVKRSPVSFLAGRVKFVLTGARFGHKSGGVDITGQI
jgi:hypothetical protein